jgi:hypothetical protein
MFKLFGAIKHQCPRCHHKSSEALDYCAACGLALVYPATNSVAKLSAQRWQPSADEVAYSFTLSPLSTIAKQGLQVPVGCDASILQNEQCHAFAAGDYSEAVLLSQLHSLRLTENATVLMSRHIPFTLSFHFDDLHSAEFMRIAARFTLQIKINDVAAFAQHFIAKAGAITCQHLEQGLAVFVRQVALEFLGAQSLREMQDNPQLRQQLDERLLTALSNPFAQFGLAVTQASTLEVRHDKISNERERLAEKTGTLWLVIDEKHAQLEQNKRLDALYSDGEWQKITHEETQIRLRYRREEMRQKFGKDLSWLYLHGEHENAKKRLSRAKLRQDESERLQTIRLRELELYGRIVDANTRKEALDRGAGDTIKELEHSLKEKSELRQNSADQWLHVRTLARIKMRTESEITQLEGKGAAQKLQLALALEQKSMQLEHEMAQAQLLDDKELKRTQTQDLRAQQILVLRREQEFADEEQKNRLINLSIETEARAREFQRRQAWEQELHLQRTRSLQREEAVKSSEVDLQIAQMRASIDGLTQANSHAEASAQHEKLLRTLETNERLEKQERRQANQAQLDALEVESMRMKLQQEAENGFWQREQQQRDAQQAHDAVLARLELERLSIIASLSETGKIAVAEIPNATLLADILKLQAQAGMSAEQILATQAGSSSHASLAMSAIAGKQDGMNADQAMKVFQEHLRDDREASLLRAREAELERRHQINLVLAQNSVGSRSSESPRAGRK